MKRPPVSLAFLLFSLLAILQWPASYTIQNISLTLGILFYEWIFVAGVPLFVGIRLFKVKHRLFPFGRPRKQWLLAMIVMTLALAVLIDYLTFFSEKILPPPVHVKKMLEQLMMVNSFPEGAWRWFLICLTPAFCEEIFFRGFFQRCCDQRWGVKIGLILTAIAFALIHGIPWYWHLYLILGVYLSWLMKIGRTLWLPILAHLINNSWTFINHALNQTLPMHGEFTNADAAVFAACAVVFFLAASKFSRDAALPMQSPF